MMTSGCRIALDWKIQTRPWYEINPDSQLQITNSIITKSHAHASDNGLWRRLLPRVRPGTK